MYRSRSQAKGFTLIELLVVIAIIGLLASIVLASLSTARNKGKDAAIQEDLHNVQAQAEIDRGAASCYSAAGVCPSSAWTFTSTNCSSGPQTLCNEASVARALQAAQVASGGLLSLQSPAGGAAYAYAVQLVTDRTKAWCVDSSGQSKMESIGGTQSQTDLNAVIVSNTTCI